MNTRILRALLLSAVAVAFAWAQGGGTYNFPCANGEQTFSYTCPDGCPQACNLDVSGASCVCSTDSGGNTSCNIQGTAISCPPLEN